MMDFDTQPYFPNDPASDCRSFGSNYYPSNQRRKISRGIPVVDSSAKFRPLKNPNNKEVAVVAPAEDDTNRVELVNDTNTGKQTKALDQDYSWLSTRSFHQKIPTPEARGTTRKAKESPAPHSVHYANLIPVLQSKESSVKQSERVMRGRKDATGKGPEKLSFSPAWEVVVEDKTDKAEEARGSETLRMKLWEILGTVSSPNNQHVDDYDLKSGAKDSDLLRNKNGEDNPVVKSRQNSDTIESDSECPNHTVKRPMTRSLSRKRTSTKLKANRAKNAPSTYHKEDTEIKNMFSSRGGFSARLSYAISGGSSIPKRKNSEKQGSATEAPKTCSHEQENLGENPQSKNHRESILPPAEKSLSLGNGGGDSKAFYSRRKNESIEPKIVALEKDSHRSPVIKTSKCQRKVIDRQKLQENVDCREDVGYSFLKNIPNKKFDAQSPSIQMKTPTKKFPPGFVPDDIKTPTTSASTDSSPKTKSGELDDHSPPETIFGKNGIQSFKSLLALKTNCYQSNSKMNSSDDAGELEDTPAVNPRPIVEEPKNRTYKPSTEDSDSDSSGGGSDVQETAASVLHLNKKQRHQDGIQITGFSPTLVSCTGAEEDNKFQQHLELNQEDGLGRAVALFALALERVKSKMKSVARKKSAEILMSVADTIHVQLQNAESQIQADVGKLTSLRKSKRKRLEMRCQELQGELNVINERFKEDINRHLQACRSMTEGLEAGQMELKVTVEKQRAFHRKLLLQAEAAIESELIDAQRRITAIQNLSRGKMLQLKNTVADCLKEGIFS